MSWYWPFASQHDDKAPRPKNSRSVPSLADRVFSPVGSAISTVETAVVRPLIGPLILLFFTGVIFFLILARVDRSLARLG